MNFRRLAVLFIIALMAAVAPDKLHSADGYRSLNPAIPVLPFEPFDDDPAIYNDCNYCHGLHNARRDVSAMLNEREERYSRYLGSSTLSEHGEQSVFDWENSRKCPRSRSKNNR